MKYFLILFTFLLSLNAFANREIGFDIGVINNLGSEPTSPNGSKYKLFIHSGELKLKSNTLTSVLASKNKINEYSKQQVIQLQTISSGATADLDNGNQVNFVAPGGTAITLNNAINGAVYNIFITDGTARTYTFTINKKESGVLTVRCSPTIAASTASKHAMFTFTRIGNNAYCSWAGDL